MNLITIFDTETSGIPDWKSPSDSPHQPHIVQLAAKVFDIDARLPVESIDLIIKPEGWVIEDDTIAIHGITQEYAMDVGIDETTATVMLLELCNNRKRVAFNTTFDNRIMRIAIKRYFGDSEANRWREGEYECAMALARKCMGGKNPTLIDAYKYFTSSDLEDAHSAMADVNACLEVYLGAKSELEITGK